MKKLIASLILGLMMIVPALGNECTLNSGNRKGPVKEVIEYGKSQGYPIELITMPKELSESFMKYYNSLPPKSNHSFNTIYIFKIPTDRGVFIVLNFANGECVERFEVLSQAQWRHQIKKWFKFRGQEADGS